MVFSRIANRYKVRDVFCLQDMLNIVKDCKIRCKHFTSDDIRVWGSILAQYYSKIPKITSFRCFRINNKNSNNVLVNFSSFNENFISINTATNSKVSEKPKSYQEAHRMTPLTKEKLKDLQKCYTYLRYIEKAISYFNSLKEEKDKIHQQHATLNARKRTRAEAEVDATPTKKRQRIADSVPTPHIPPTILSGLITLKLGDLA